MEEIIKELHLLKLPGMAGCWTSLDETHQLDKLSLRDGLELLVQAENEARHSNRITKLIKDAHFRDKACIEELDMDNARGIDAGEVARLGTCEYIKNGIPVLITGACGCGKSFLAAALGDKACRMGYHVCYYNMQKLLDAIKLARMEGHEMHFFDKLIKCDLLILDDFGMKKLEGQQQNDFEQIIDDRYNRKSLIIVSQLPIADWYDVINNELIAEACLDRIVHKAVRFELKGDSLRKKY